MVFDRFILRCFKGKAFRPLREINDFFCSRRYHNNPPFFQGYNNPNLGSSQYPLDLGDMGLFTEVVLSEVMWC